MDPCSLVVYVLLSVVNSVFKDSILFEISSNKKGNSLNLIF